MLFATSSALFITEDCLIPELEPCMFFAYVSDLFIMLFTNCHDVTMDNDALIERLLCKGN